MHNAVYNLAIPKVIIQTVGLNPLSRAARPAFGFCVVLCGAFLILGFTAEANAADWSVPEQQLARKIIAVTGPGPALVTFENRSSLNRREVEIVGNGLHSALQTLGLRFAKPEPAASATVVISLSESLNAYVWVAEIRQPDGKSIIEMVSTPRGEALATAGDSLPLTLRKIPLFAQEQPILDVLVLEENPAPTRIAVLGPEDVSLYRLQAGKWQREQGLSVTHARAWPRDLRGRLVPGRDHLLDAYLPGVICRSTSGTALSLTCQESDDPWPLVPGQAGGGISANFPSMGPSTLPAIPPVGAFFASARNFFTGVLAPGIGQFGTVPKFYSAAFLPSGKNVLWLFAAVDGQIHMIDGVSDLPTKLYWGSDVASVRTSCGAGWQVLAVSAGAPGSDSIRAYEFPDRDAVSVSPALDLGATVTALWAEAKGDTAIVVTSNAETGEYEAFRVAVACAQ